MTCHRNPSECDRHNHCARNDECFEAGLKSFYVPLASIDYKYLRPRLEKVTFPSHDAYDREPFTVLLTEREADEITVDWAYYRGYRPANYPVPAIPVRVGYEPSGTGGMRGVPYIWLSYGYNRMTTFWKGFDPILEWVDTNGRRWLRIVYFK